MSGGVDSSAAASLLQEAGNDVIGVTMQLWNQDRLPQLKAQAGIRSSGHCCSLDDVYDARRVADFLGFPFYVVNFSAAFEERVVRPFVEEYGRGRTPIPCVECNNVFKFDLLLTRARQLGAEKLATGHYARIRFNETTGRHELWRGVDSSKDQSYFLFGMTQEQLARTEFPLGEMTKPEVREMARQRHLPTREKPESQEICFVPGHAYADFIAAYQAERSENGNGFLPDEQSSGDVVLSDGTVVGHHQGVHHFTVGQRKGLGIAVGHPLYVLSIDSDRKQVVVGENPELLRQKVQVSDMNWISIEKLQEPMRVSAKIRNKHEAAPGMVQPRPAGGAVMVFDEPQRAITPGQACVFYHNDVVIGGGWIDAAEA